MIAWPKRGAPHSPAVRARIERLNRDTQEGELLRGWHPAPTFWRLTGTYGTVGLVRVGDFDARWGPGAAARLPREAFYRSGKRRWILPRFYQYGEGVWNKPSPGR